MVFSDYRVSPNFLVVLGLRLWLRLGLGCDNYGNENKYYISILVLVCLIYLLNCYY